MTADKANAKPETAAISSELYSAFVHQVDREDRLFNHRLTWLLTSQGLLFGTLAIMASQEHGKVDAMIVGQLRFWLPVLGICIGASSYGAAMCGHLVVRRLKFKWDSLAHEDLKTTDRLPSPFGGQLEGHSFLLAPSLVLPAIITVAWISIFTALFVR